MICSAHCTFRPAELTRGAYVQNLGTQLASHFLERFSWWPEFHPQEFRQHRHRGLEARQHANLPLGDCDAGGSHGVVPLFPHGRLGDSLRTVVPADSEDFKGYSLFRPPEIRSNKRRAKATSGLNGNLNPVVHEWLRQPKASRVARAKRQGVCLGFKRRCQTIGHQCERPPYLPSPRSTRHRIQVV